MTKVEMSPGPCGFSVIVTAKESGNKKVMITIETDCGQVKELAHVIEYLTIQDIFGSPFSEDGVYQAAKKVILVVLCLVGLSRLRK